MGMFDDIECKYPLPQPENPRGFAGEIYFQTKDLECCLDKYEIREDGTFWLFNVEYEYPKDVDSMSLTEISAGIKTKRTWYEQINISKTIQMYSFIHGENDHDYWIQYDVTFADGKVNNVVISKFEATNNVERKKITEENLKKFKAWTEYTKTKRYKYIRKPYNTIIKSVFTTVISILDKIKAALINIQYFLLVK